MDLLARFQAPERELGSWPSELHFYKDTSISGVPFLQSTTPKAPLRQIPAPGGAIAENSSTRWR